MTRQGKNKMLDDKTESNVNQYKVDRLNAEISAFSSRDLNKYEFLTIKYINHKPNALDKAKFEFSPLGQTFSTELNKTAQGYLEEGVIKLLKDIRDGLARAPRVPPRVPLGGPPYRPDDDDYNDNDDSDDDKNMPHLETEDEAARTTVLNKFNDKIDHFDEMFKDKENEFNEMFEDKENKFSSKLNKLNNNIKN